MVRIYTALNWILVREIFLTWMNFITSLLLHYQVNLSDNFQMLIVHILPLLLMISLDRDALFGK